MALPTHWALKTETEKCELIKERCHAVLRRMKRRQRNPSDRELIYLGEAVGYLRLCEYEDAWKAVTEAERRGKDLPKPADYEEEDIQQLDLDRLSEMVKQVRCLGASMRDNTLGLRTDGDLVSTADGYLLQATDGDRTIAFVLPAPVALEVFPFDMQAGGLLETYLRDRLPEIWAACRRAYNVLALLEDKQRLQITLTPSHFISD